MCGGGGGVGGLYGKGVWGQGKEPGNDHMKREEGRPGTKKGSKKKENGGCFAKKVGGKSGKRNSRTHSGNGNVLPVDSTPEKKKKKGGEQEIKKKTAKKIFSNSTSMGSRIKKKGGEKKKRGVRVWCKTNSLMRGKGRVCSRTQKKIER